MQSLEWFHQCGSHRMAIAPLPRRPHVADDLRPHSPTAYWACRFAMHALVMLGGAALLIACGQGIARAANDRQVLGSFPASGQPEHVTRQHYELSLLSCKSGHCPFVVRLLPGVDQSRPVVVEGDSGASMRGSTMLEWPASAAPARQLPSRSGTALIQSAGAAEPLVWSTGEGEDGVSVSASAVPLEPDRPTQESALLVTQAAGFDHPKRRHALYVAVLGEPKVVWSRSERQGPYLSWVVVPAGSAPVHVSVFFSPDDDVADTVSAQRLVWDARRRTFSEEPATPALQAVVAGSYASLRAARAARAASRCFGGYATVDTGPGKGLVRHRYALVALAVEPAQVMAETARLLTCQAGIAVRSHPLKDLSPRSLSIQ